MKLALTLNLAALVTCLGLNACALLGKKKSNEAVSGPLPPPSSLASTKADQPAKQEPEALPELPSAPEKPSQGPGTPAALTRSGDFVFRDPTKVLPKSSDLGASAQRMPLATETLVESAD